MGVGGANFRGTERFEVVGPLGRGAMGVVYQAIDRERGIPVALKMLKNVDPNAIYRFKREFRALADTAHPNLVSLYELFAVDDQWFFTMEVVDGVDFVTWVRKGGDAFASPPGTGARPDTADTRVVATESVSSTQRAGKGDPTLGDTPKQRGNVAGVRRTATGSTVHTLPPLETDEQYARLRSGLLQLAEGVVALHEAGHLHRDVKPSNVLVTRDERVVLMDFGVVTELAAAGAGERGIVGTPAYMSPEQAAGRPVSEASDWYAVGVILYEAITGRKPFTGDMNTILTDKQHAEPPPPRLHQPVVPTRLNDLCVDLLATDPTRRPTDDAVVERLGGQRESVNISVNLDRGPDVESHLVGREQHLGVLRKAFADTHTGESVIAFVEGLSGMGKTALVEAFLDEVRTQRDVVVLVGRCYERESVPYKAVDSLIDSLSRFLMDLPAHEAKALMPRDAPMLARVFPVLKRVEALAAVRRRRRPGDAVDPHEVRRRAFAALRELLGRLADERPVVMFIDDLQWGDADSGALIEALVRPPDAPPLLLLGSYRSDDTEHTPLLEVLRRGVLERARFVSVDALTDADARRLAGTLLGGGNPAVAAKVASESRGNPFLIDELARYARGAGALLEAAGAFSLDHVVKARADRLSDDARRVLAMVAVAGKPTGQAVVERAAELDDARSLTALQELKTARLVRVSGARGDDVVETYHDRIRQSVLERLGDDDRRSHHRRLAIALQSSPQPDPESLAVHFLGAGENDAAAEHAIQAADAAAEALAFDRAAELYRLALSLQTADGALRSDLERKLGDALANAGRGAEAAEVYARSAEGATTAARIDLQRRAAMQYLISGRIEEGIEALRVVLAAVGMTLPASRSGKLLRFLGRRVHVRLRGLRYRKRDLSESKAADLLRLEVLWSAAIGLSMVEPLVAGYFQARYLLGALATGDELLIARGLAFEATHAATPGGTRGRRRAEALLSAAQEIADRVDDPHLTALCHLNRGGVAFLAGRWKTALAETDRAEKLFRSECTGVAWERNTALAFQLWPLFHLGEVREIRARVPDLISDAEGRGDLNMLYNLATWIKPICQIAADEAEEARRDLDEVERRLPAGEFQLQHLNALIGKILIGLYRQRGDEAHAVACEAWPALKRSLLLEVEQIRIAMNLWRGAAAVRAGELDDAARCLRVARWRKGEWGDAVGLALAADLMMARGRRDRAVELLEQAEAALDDLDMTLFAMCARRARGLHGGDAGAALVADADERMRAQDIENPARLAAAVLTMAGSSYTVRS